MVLLPDQPFHGYLVMWYTSSFNHPYYKGRLLLGIFIPPVAAVRAPPVWNASGVVTRDFSGDSRLPKWYFWWTVFFFHPAVQKVSGEGRPPEFLSPFITLIITNLRLGAGPVSLHASQSGILFKEGSKPRWPVLERTFFIIRIHVNSNVLMVHDDLFTSNSKLNLVSFLTVSTATIILWNIQGCSVLSLNYDRRKQGLGPSTPGHH